MLKNQINNDINLEFHAKTLNIDNGIINIYIKPSSLNIKYEMVLENRKNKKIEIIKLQNLNIDNETYLNAQINIFEYINFIKSGIIDIYIKPQDTNKIYRLKSGFTSSIEDEFYYFNLSNHVINVYTTVKGNLSLKYEAAKNKLCVENIKIEKQGILHIEGYILIPKWDISEEYKVKKEILLSLSDDNEKEIAIPVNSVYRPDITKKYNNIGKNYDLSGFYIDINLLDNNLDIFTNKLLDIKVKVSNKEESITIPLNACNIKFIREAYIERQGGVCKLELRTNDKDNNLKLLINQYNREAQVNTVYVNEESIEIQGYLPECCSELESISNDINLIIRNRRSKKEIILDCIVKNNNFLCDININNLISEGYLENGIFDFFIKVNEICYRLSNKLDGIPNKQKIVNLPQIITNNIEGNAIAIKPYYTLQEELSLLVRNYASVKKIDVVKETKEAIIIKGLLNIQPPNSKVLDESDGRIVIKASYGREFDLPVQWKLKFTGKTNLEFEFEIVISKYVLKDNNITSKDILENINFDLIKSEIYLEKFKINILLNIESSKVEVNSSYKFEDIEFINKNRLKLYKIFNKLLPINKNIAVFQSFHGKSYACNPKAIYEELLSEDNNVKSVWILNDINKKLPGNPIIVKPKSIKYYYYMAIGKYFINNGNFPDFYEKREGTVHLQTWHGTPLKKLGFDINPDSPAYAENTSFELMRRNSRWDYLIAPNQYTGEILQRAFKFDKNLLTVGYPRNDILTKLNDNKIKEIKKRLNIPSDKKVILYAPTWRDYEFHSGNIGQPYEFKFDMDRFKDEFGQDYVMLLRLHYRDASRINISGYENIVYNVSSYDDIQELYLISDILITDYSSVMFDYAILDRPIIFFTYDLKRYGSEVRGFYFNFLKEAPGPVVLDQDSLFDSIKDIENIKINYRNRYDKFKDKFCKLEDGKAAKRTISAVFK